MPLRGWALYGIPHIQILFNTVSTYYAIIYTILLLRSLKDNYKKITLHNIVVLIVKWIKKSAFNQNSGVRIPAGALFHKIKRKFKNSWIWKRMLQQKKIYVWVRSGCEVCQRAHTHWDIVNARKWGLGINNTVCLQKIAIIRRTQNPLFWIHLLDVPGAGTYLFIVFLFLSWKQPIIHVLSEVMERKTVDSYGFIITVSKMLRFPCFIMFWIPPKVIWRQYVRTC